METEHFFTGYCRTTDTSRTVCVVTENGKAAEIDCSYESCPYTGNCAVAKKIEKLSE